MDVSELRELEEDVVLAVETAASVAQEVSLGTERDEAALRELSDRYLEIIDRIRKGLATAMVQKHESKTSTRDAHLSMKEIELEQRKVQAILMRLDRMKDRLGMDASEMDVS